ncbi:hypothetical protein FALCPG4_000854 [Fusarium falciforme]
MDGIHGWDGAQQHPWSRRMQPLNEAGVSMNTAMRWPPGSLKPFTDAWGKDGEQSKAGWIMGMDVISTGSDEWTAWQPSLFFIAVNKIRRVGWAEMQAMISCNEQNDPLAPCLFSA